MCGEPMQLVEREFVDRAPGTGETRQQRVREWVCRECDYFEEAEKGDTES